MKDGRPPDPCTSPVKFQVHTETDKNNVAVADSQLSPDPEAITQDDNDVHELGTLSSSKSDDSRSEYYKPTVDKITMDSPGHQCLIIDCVAASNNDSLNPTTSEHVNNVAMYERLLFGMPHSINPRKPFSGPGVLLSRGPTDYGSEASRQVSSSLSRSNASYSTHCIRPQASSEVQAAIVHQQGSVLTSAIETILDETVAAYYELMPMDCMSKILGSDVSQSITRYLMTNFLNSLTRFRQAHPPLGRLKNWKSDMSPLSM